MPNNSGIHHNEMLISSDWPSFFEELSQSHQDRPVTIEQDDDLLLDNPPGDGVPLQEIEFRSGHKQKLLVITTAAQTYTIEAPNLIWVIRNEQGELVAVEIIDARDREFVVRFV